MIKRYKVSGHSMEPNFFSGDNLIAASLFFRLKKGDVVIFGDGSKEYLKRVKGINGKKIEVAGDNETHSRIYSIERSQIKAKFLMKC
ncbi:S24/S26 family peptidase [Candidatus Woesearchaeota archaeon]|nr:S24/S26 family peptidase [Candidatus Woesearchaeota archaeon]